jgi:hypothetical protein
MRAHARMYDTACVSLTMSTYYHVVCTFFSIRESEQMRNVEGKCTHAHNTHDGGICTSQAFHCYLQGGMLLTACLQSRQVCSYIINIHSHTHTLLVLRGLLTRAQRLQAAKSAYSSSWTSYRSERRCCMQILHGASAFFCAVCR